MNLDPITVQTDVNASPQVAWEFYTNPKHHDMLEFCIT